MWSTTHSLSSAQLEWRSSTAQGGSVSHKAKDMALRPHSQPLDKQLATLDRSHQARQNAKSQPVKLNPPKGPKPR